MKRILIVDDEYDVVEFLGKRLEAQGYEILRAFDGMYAVAEAISKKPDLVILDYRLPVEDGVSVFDKLKMWSDTANIPVIFVTAYPSDELRQKILGMGAADIFSKPFDLAKLTERINQILT